MNSNIPFNYYDVGRGWDETNKGWHTIIIENTQSFRHLDMVNWLYDRIDNTEKHSRWVRLQNSSGFKFRYERDYILFTLTWS